MVATPLQSNYMQLLHIITYFFVWTLKMDSLLHIQKKGFRFSPKTDFLFSLNLSPYLSHLQQSHTQQNKIQLKLTSSFQIP